VENCWNWVTSAYVILCSNKVPQAPWVMSQNCIHLLFCPSKSSGYYMYHQFNIKQFYVLPKQCIYVFVWIWEQTAIMPLCSINWLVCITDITLQTSVVTICTTRFNMQQFYVLPPQCIYVFCVDPRTNSDYFPLQH